MFSMVSSGLGLVLGWAWARLGLGLGWAWSGLTLGLAGLLWANFYISSGSSHCLTMFKQQHDIRSGKENNNMNSDSNNDLNNNNNSNNNKDDNDNDNTTL